MLDQVHSQYNWDITSQLGSRTVQKGRKDSYPVVCCEDGLAGKVCSFCGVPGCKGRDEVLSQDVL